LRGRDPVCKSIGSVTPTSEGLRRARFVLLLPLLTLFACALDYVTRISPPSLPAPEPEEVRYGDTSVRVGPAYLTRRGRLWVTHVKGTPVELGYRYARLTTPMMAEGDRRMRALFETLVPSPAFRWAMTSYVRVHYRHLGEELPSARRAELFGEASGYADDFKDSFPTYQRFVYLHGLYDISLAFEHSPLLGCTAFAASGSATSDGTTPGHTIVGRNFDLDVDPWFDNDKVVHIVEPETGLAFVSVAWPGMLGVVSGMNEEGIWISVNGARAGEPRNEGVPIVFTTRAVLEEARSLDDALAIIARYPPMVSHILFLADGKTGESMIVERAPNLPSGVVRYPAAAVVSNHFRTSPLRDDPKDARIREITSTEARQARMEELLGRHYGHVDPQVAVAILRDRSGVGDTALPLGNRNAVDALVATHSVVADLTARVIWVSEGPNTLGPYRRFDLGERLRHGEAAARGEVEGDFAPDPLLTDEMYERYCLGTRARAGAEKRAAEGRVDAAADLYRCALALRDDDHLAWRGLALAEERLGHAGEAQSAWARVLALVPDTPDGKREAEEHLRPR
jgi:hypothetical protein